jgi:hypothetical protein
MSIVKFYSSEILTNLGYLPVWLPTISANPGDVGRLKQTGFEKETDLNELGISFETEPGKASVNFDYASEGVASTQLNAEAKLDTEITGGNADAQISIHFQRDNAVLFKATNCRSRIIKNKMMIGNKILELYNNDRWDLELVLVTETVSAGSCTVLISKEAGAFVTLGAKGNVSTESVDLANVNAGFKVIRDKNMAVKIVANKSLTPLFKVGGVRKQFLRDAEFRSASPEKKMEELRFVELDHEDYEEQ